MRDARERSAARRRRARRGAWGALLVVAALGCASEAKYIEAGQALAAQRQYDAAIEQFLSALEEYPGSAAANLNLGLVYVALKRYDEALKAIELARARQESEEVLVALAMTHYQMGELAKAAATMEQALAIAPDRGMNHLRLGVIRKEAGDLERAVESFRMAMAQDPGLIEARVTLGLTLKELKRHDEALEVLKDAVKEVRDTPENVSGVQAGLGEVYEAMNMSDYAVHSYKLALKNNPKNPVAIAGMGRVLRTQGRFEEAVELLTDGNTKVPQDPRITLQLGLAYKEFRMEPLAIKALLQAIDLDPKQTEAYEPLIALLDKHGPPADLFKALAAAAKALPDDLALQLRAGKLARERKAPEVAVRALKRALEIEPANIEANFNLGLAQIDLDDLDAATETLNTLKYLDGGKAEDLARSIEAARNAPDDDPRGKGKSKKKRKGRKRR